MLSGVRGLLPHPLLQTADSAGAVRSTQSDDRRSESEIGAAGPGAAGAGGSVHPEGVRHRRAGHIRRGTNHGEVRISLKSIGQTNNVLIEKTLYKKVQTA